MERAKLLGTTAMLTVLIWASADSLVSETITLSLSVDVEPRALGSNMIIAADPSVEVQVSGPRKTIEDLRARRLQQVRLPISDRPTGESPILLDKQVLKRQLTRQWREFRKLSIVAIDPADLTVVVDHTITQEVDITFKRLTLAYDVEPKLSRARAEVRMRESVFREIAPSGRLAPIDLSAEVERQLKDKPAGQSTPISIALDGSVFGPGAQIHPPTIEVTATVSAQRSTEEIQTVPILLAVSFANLERPFAAVPRDGVVPVTRTIKVTGPTEEVVRLLGGETRAFGLIQLKEDDLHAWDDFRALRPEYHLPPGIELAEEPKPVEFKLIEQSDTTRID